MIASNLDVVRRALAQLLMECYNSTGSSTARLHAPQDPSLPQVMCPQESGNNGLPNYQRHARLVFDRIRRHMRELGKEPKSSEVHRFRTNSRRVEALLKEFASDSGNTRKLLKALSKLRKKAGKLRDLDVQIEFLQNLKIPDRQNHRSQLLEILNSERSKHSRKLPKRFDADTLSKLRKRLGRASSAIELNGVDPFRRAIERVPELAARDLNERTLHGFRIAAKGARYVAELVDSPEANSFIAELKKAQDAIGEWHDVLKLKEQAEKLFGRVHDSPLVAALNNISRARFRRASNAALEAVANVAKLSSATPKAPPRKAAIEAEVATAA